MKRPRILYLSEFTYNILLQFFIGMGNTIAFLVMHFLTTQTGEFSESSFNAIILFFIGGAVCFGYWVLKLIGKFGIYMDEFWKLTGVILWVLFMLFMIFYVEEDSGLRWPSFIYVSLANVLFIIYLRFCIVKEIDTTGFYSDKQGESYANHAINSLIDRGTKESSSLKDLEMP